MGVLLIPLVTVAIGLSGSLAHALPETQPTSEWRALRDQDAPLIDAVAANDRAATKSALDSGINVEALARGKHSSLYIAASNGSIQVAKLLLERGANVNADSGVGLGTALNAAIDGGHNEVADVLLAAGAKT